MHLRWKTQTSSSDPPLPVLTLTYPTTSVAFHTHEPFPWLKLFLLIILVLVVFSIAAHYVFKYLQKRFGGRVTGMTEEEDIGAGASQTNPTDNVLKNNTGAVSDAPLKETM